MDHPAVIGIIERGNSVESDQFYDAPSSMTNSLNNFILQNETKIVSGNNNNNDDVNTVQIEVPSSSTEHSGTTTTTTTNGGASNVTESTATCTALLIDHVQDDDDDDAVLHSSPDSTAPYSQLRPQFHEEQQQQQQQQQQHQRQHSISIMNAPFYMQLALITPRNSLEALTMGLDEAAMPALNLPQLQQQKQQQHHQQQQPNRRKSRHNRRSRRKSPCASFCYEHFTKIICGGLLLLFIFNMTLYSYIFYLAHIEGHEF